MTSGDVERARQEMRRTLAAWEEALREGALVVGLEPSCTLGMKEELPGMLGETGASVAEKIYLFEEFLALRQPGLGLKAPAKRALLHGHCHQKAHRQMSAVESVLGMIPGLEVEAIDSACCGMAGAFGYGRDTREVSEQMAELTLLPAVRKADRDTLIVADGTSCRHQIELGAQRKALHVARVLDMALQQE